MNRQGRGFDPHQVDVCEDGNSSHPCCVLACLSFLGIEEKGSAVLGLLEKPIHGETRISPPLIC